MTFQVNGGIISDQTLTGRLRFFKMIAPGTEFAWTISDGTVNLPVSITGGTGPTTTYFEVGVDRPVPNSAADLAFRVIGRQADIVIIGMDDTYGDTTILYFALSASALGWGSDTPGYSAPPADQDEDPLAAAAQMQVAVRALGIVTVYITAGAVPPLNEQTPVSAMVNLNTITITEVPFNLI